MLKKMVRKFGKNFAALALAVGVISTSQVCHFFLNQPEVPDEMKKMVDRRKKQRVKGCQRKGGDRMCSDMIYRVMIEKSVLFIWQWNTEKNYTYTKSKTIAKMEAEGNGNTASTTVTNIAKSKRFYSETYFIGRNFI